MKEEREYRETSTYIVHTLLLNQYTTFVVIDDLHTECVYRRLQARARHAFQLSVDFSSASVSERSILKKSYCVSPQSVILNL